MTQPQPEPSTVIVASEIIPLIAAVGGYDETSAVPFQRQFDAAIGVLLVMWNYQSPLERQAIQRLVQESDRIDPETN